MLYEQALRKIAPSSKPLRTGAKENVGARQNEFRLLTQQPVLVAKVTNERNVPFVTPAA